MQAVKYLLICSGIQQHPRKKKQKYINQSEMSLIQGSRVMSLPLSKELNFVFKAKRQCALNPHPAWQLEIALGQLTPNSFSQIECASMCVDQTEGSCVC